MAEDFIRSTGIESFEMYWDPSFESWRHFGVSVNSEAWLVSADGTLIGERFFGFDSEAILDAVA